MLMPIGFKSTPGDRRLFHLYPAFAPVVVVVNPHFFNSQLCCVEGEKEREKMMQNENRTQLLTIKITMSHDS